MTSSTLRLPGWVLDLELANKLSGIVDVSEELLRRIPTEKYDLAELAVPLRTALFSVFESHGNAHAQCPFARWSSEAHELEHKPTCKKGKGLWSVADRVITSQEAHEGDLRWFVLREMQRRVDHLNEHTMPALKLVGHASVLTPRTHTGSCTKCKSIATASSVTVEIMWRDGVSMRREYRL